MEYAYKLKGMNGEWVATDLNEVTLRNLPYGNYQLQVRCRLRNQPWPNEIATLDIVVTPPFWLSWPAKVFYALLLLGLLIAFMRFYKRKIRLEYLYQSEKRQHEHEQELNQERMRFYTNITHELRTPPDADNGPARRYFASFRYSQRSQTQTGRHPQQCRATQQPHQSDSGVQENGNTEQEAVCLQRQSHSAYL